MKWSSSSVTSLISSAVMQSWMSVHDSVALMVMCMPGISSPLFASLLCLDSQSVMNICGYGLHSILIFYLCIHSCVLFSLCDMLPTSFLKIAISGCGLWLCWLQRQISVDDCFLGWLVFQVFPFLCCYSSYLYLSGLYFIVFFTLMKITLVAA